MQQVIGYKVPLDKYDDLAMYHVSVVVERTNGRRRARSVGALCESLGARLVRSVQCSAV